MAKKNRWRKYFFLTGMLAVALSVFGVLRLRDFGQTPLPLPATAMVTATAKEKIVRAQRTHSTSARNRPS